MEKSQRIVSIDFLRGLAMIIMALDHVRDFFGYGSFFTDPTDLAATNPFLFFTRWITHFCAPVFVFLAGTSAFLYGKKQNSKKDLSVFLLTRGVWLIFIELVIVNFGWTFDITLSFHILQVIWAIGICMIVLSAAVFLSNKIILAIGLILIFGHNTLDSIRLSGNDPLSIIWYLLHQSKVVFASESTAWLIHYPVLPWIGVMMTGYVFGELYKKEFLREKRKKILLEIGSASILLFIILRTFNLYGDMNPWDEQETFIFSVLSFLNTTKYPPSLLFLLMTLGPAMFLLAWIENKGGALMKKVIVFGRVPFFYYVIHIYFIHLLAFIGILVYGGQISEMIFTAENFTSAHLRNYGYSLIVVYLIWILVILLLYPICKKYNEYKSANKDKKWLSYL